MGTFRITILAARDEGWPVVVERPAAQSVTPYRHEGVFRLATSEVDALRAAQIDPEAYGRILGKALFQGEIGAAFAAAHHETPDGERLRVLLTIEDDALRSWRWERLYAPFESGGDLLALNQRIPLSFYLPSVTSRRFPPIRRSDLRVLIVAASPSQMEAAELIDFDVVEAVSGVQTALGDIPNDVLVSPDVSGELAGVVGPATFDRISERITECGYTMLHMICHGSLAESGNGVADAVLYLAKIDGSVDPVPATDFLRQLQRLHPEHEFPRFAFLTACKSASTAPIAAGRLGGLAQRLVQDVGMLAVVAMTDVVSVKTANAMANAFYHQLLEHGEPDLALVAATAGLAERGDVTVPALYSRLAGESLISKTEVQLPDLTNDQILTGLELAAPLLANRAPVLLRDDEFSDGARSSFEALAAELRSLTRATVSQLSTSAQSARLRALEDVDHISSESLDLSFAALAIGEHPPDYDDHCPFVGSRPFRAEDCEVFFGRGDAVDTLRQKLDEHPFLALLGPSGCGKSSLVFAGLMPKLLPENGAKARWRRSAEGMRPGDDPLPWLERLLAGGDETTGVVVVDQFEEVFTVCRDEARRLAFFDRLLSLAPQRRVVLTMRADFQGECARYPQLWEAMEPHVLEVIPLDSQPLRAAVEEQAKNAGLEFEASLAETILGDVQGEPGAMRIVQQTLWGLWQRRHGRWLTVAEYRATGGVRGAVTRTAEAFYEGLPALDRERLRGIVLRLIRLDDDEPDAAERRDSGRRVALETLTPAGESAFATRELVARMASAGLVVTSCRGRNPVSSNAGTGDATVVEQSAEAQAEVDIAHEALVQDWPRVQEWLASDRVFLRRRDALHQQAVEWGQRGKCDEDLEDQASRLEEAESLRRPSLGLNALETVYLDASRAMQERRQEEDAAAEIRAKAGEAAMAKAKADQRWLRTSVVVAGLLALLAGLAIWQWREADTERTLAVTLGATAEAALDLVNDQARILMSRHLATSASNLAGDPSHLDLLLALQANRIVDSVPRAKPEDFSRSGGSLLTTLQANPAYLGRLTGHVGAVWSGAFNADQALFASGGEDGAVRLWKLDQPGAAPTILPGHENKVEALAFSPDGLTLASGSGNSVLLWDLNDLEAGPRTGVGHQGETIKSLAFSHDGELLASSGYTDHSIILWDWDAENPSPVASIENISGNVGDVAFGPEDETLITTSDDNHIRFWDAQTLEQIDSLDISDYGWVLNLVFSQDGNTMATGSQDGTIIVWDVITRQRLWEYRDETMDWVRGLAFSPDGKTLAAGGRNGDVILLDLGTHRPIGPPLTGHTGSIMSLDFNSQDGTLASTSEDGTIVFWNLDSPHRLVMAHVGNGDQPAASSLAVSAKGVVAVGRTDGSLVLWNTEPLAELKPLVGHTRWVHSVAFTPDGSKLASGSEDGTVILWDVATGVGKLLPGVHGEVSSVAFNRDGDMLAAGMCNDPRGPGADRDRCVPGEIRVWNLDDLQKSFSLRDGVNGAVLSVAFSPDGTKLASSLRTGQIVVWDLAKRREISRLGEETRDWLFSIGFLDDFTLAACCDDTSVVLWDLKTQQRTGSLFGHKGAVRDMRVSLAGSTLATVGKDRTLRLWDVESLQPIGAPLTNRNPAPGNTVAFSPDGTVAATGSSTGGVVLLWDVDPASWKTKACEVANRNLSRAEWDRFVGADIDYDQTCPGFPPGEGVVAGEVGAG